MFPEGIEVVREVLSEQTYHVDYPEFASVYGCYDEIGVRDFNLDVPINDVVVDLEGSTVNLGVHFGTIEGTGMTLFANDSDWADACVGFETGLDLVRLDNARLTAGFDVAVEGGIVVLEFVEAPALSGDLQTDVGWFPDEIALAFFEEAILSSIADSIGGMLPDTVASLSADAIQFGDYGDFEVGLALGDIAVDTQAMSFAATADIGWLGEGSCVPSPNSEPSTGRTPKLDLTDSPGSGFAVGITESMLNELFVAAWRDGYFCFDQQETSILVASLSSSFDPDVAGLTAQGSLGSAPRIKMSEAGIELVLEDLWLSIEGEHQGQKTEVLELRLDLRTLLDVQLDQAYTSFTLSVHDLEVQVRDLSAKHLLAKEDSGERLVAFIETWAAGWAESKAQDVVLFSSLYYLWDLALKLDHVAYEPGGIELYASLFTDDDPAVDKVAPETEVIAWGSEAGARLQWSGSDDRSEALVYSYRIDGGDWSGWTADGGAEATDLLPGVHEVEVVARDAWLNVDASPAIASFSVGTAQTEPPGCSGCAGMGASGPWAVLLGLLGLVRRQRRQNA